MKSDWFFYSTIAALFLVMILAAVSAPAQTFATLYSFDQSDGIFPGELIQAIDGNFYGTTAYGGAYNNCNTGIACGTVFKITPEGTLITLHSFCAQAGCPDGKSPNGRLIQGTDGNFYGTTIAGGTFDGGTVFQITPEGTLTTLHSFCAQTDCPDPAQPMAGLIQAADGNFYGTTAWGGAYGGGTVFKITPGGVLTILHSFDGTGSVGRGRLIQATDESFYGTTTSGGASGTGTIFKITSEGMLTTLHIFGFQSPDGSYPNDLIQGNDGNFYGTTNGGGANGLGTAFRITAAGTLTTLYSFCSDTKCFDGDHLLGGLIQASDGNFYGTANEGGANTCAVVGCGTIFEITQTGTLGVLHRFAGIDGALPAGSLIQARDGSFYGSTLGGGGSNKCASGCGTVFRLTVAPAATLTPRTLTFGNQPLNQTTAAQTVRLKNSGTALLIMSGIAIDGSSFAISANTCGDALAIGQTCTVSVTFTPKSLGKLTGTLRFSDNASNNPQLVPLSGTCVYPTSTTLSSSLNPSMYGQNVTFTARVTTSGPVPPTGTVVFMWKYFTTTYTIGTATLNSAGMATLTKSNLNAGSYPIMAVYRGDTNNLSSMSTLLNQTVLQTASVAAITSSANPSTVGQAVTFTAKITSPTVIPSGPVTFKAGTTVLGTSQLSGGKAIFTTSTLPAGSTAMKVIYNGNSNIKGSSASLTQAVQP
jgi:uncharacterized repeat protein (TIGR03803 family)